MREMRAVAFATRLIDNAELDGTKRGGMLIHWIGNDRLMSQLGTATQFHPGWGLLCRLRDEGRESAGKWRTEFRRGRHPFDGGRQRHVSLMRGFATRRT